MYVCIVCMSLCLLILMENQGPKKGERDKKDALNIWHSTGDQILIFLSHISISFPSMIQRELFRDLRSQAKRAIQEKRTYINKKQDVKRQSPPKIVLQPQIKNTGCPETHLQLSHSYWTSSRFTWKIKLPMPFRHPIVLL